MSNLLSLMYFSITSNNLSSFCSCCSILLASTSILLASWSNLSATRSIFSSSTNGTGSAVIVLKYLLGKGFNEQLIGFSSASISCNCQENGHPEADSYAVVMFTIVGVSQIHFTPGKYALLTLDSFEAIFGCFSTFFMQDKHKDSAHPLI